MLLARGTRLDDDVLSLVLLNLSLGYFGYPFELRHQLLVGGLIGCDSSAASCSSPASLPGARPPLAGEAAFEVPGGRSPVPGFHRGPDRDDTQLGGAPLGPLQRVQKVQIWPVVGLGLAAPVQPLTSRPARRGDAYNNALAESFFATLETELLDRHTFLTRDHARIALLHYIEGFYNTRPHHSALGNLSPRRFEENNEQQPTQNSRRCLTNRCQPNRDNSRVRASGVLRTPGRTLSHVQKVQKWPG